MLYLISQLFWLLAIAFVIGVACGWYFYRRREA
jgi:hypothetical protein